MRSTTIIIRRVGRECITVIECGDNTVTWADDGILKDFLLGREDATTKLRESIQTVIVNAASQEQA